MIYCVCSVSECEVTQSCPTLCDPWTVAHQAPLSVEFFRQEYWSGCHFLFQGIFLTQKLNPGLLHCRQTLTNWATRETLFILYHLGEGGHRGWDGWMASLTQWTWVWINSRRQWRAGKPGSLQPVRSQRVRHDLTTEQQQHLFRSPRFQWWQNHQKDFYLLVLNLFWIN